MIKENDIRPDELTKLQKKYIEEDIKFLQSKNQNFVTVNCPACNTKNSQVEMIKNDFQYVECRNCGMLYMTPRPTIDILGEFYSNSTNYKFFNDYIFPASMEARRHKIFIPRVNKVLEICNKYNVKTDKILEIGTGFGLFCEEIAKKNIFKDIVGIEASNSLSETCTEKGFRVYNGILEELEINETFDVIVSFEVIEHIFNPGNFLERSNELLNKSGILMLTFPNYNGFDVGILRENSLSVDHEHLNYFNEKAISIILENNGFSVLSVETPGQLDLELVRKAILNNNFKPNSFIYDICINKFDKIGEEFQNYLIKNKLSSNMMIIAQKIND